MVYFVSAVNPLNARSGLEKRGHMWWQYWRQAQGEVTWIELPEQWLRGSRLNRLLLALIPFCWLPRRVQLFLFFSGSSLRNLGRHNARIKSVLGQATGADDVVFIFRAYHLYYLPVPTLTRLLSQSQSVVIDFDESDYLSINTFTNPGRYWPRVAPRVNRLEQLLLGFPQVRYYVSGANESAKMQAAYGGKSPLLVQYNQLVIAPPFIEKGVSRPIKLLLVGTYGYEPNRAMIHSLLDSVIPALRPTHCLEFHIVGGGLSPALIEQLRAYSFVTVYGYLPDATLDALYRQVHFTLTVLTAGGGTKYKLIESMAYGTPMVATTTAVMGLAIEPLKQYIPFELRTLEQTLERYLTDSAAYQQMQASCYATYRAFYYRPVE